MYVQIWIHLRKNRGCIFYVLCHDSFYLIIALDLKSDVIYFSYNNKYSTVKRSYDSITMFIKFVDKYVPELESFSKILPVLLIINFEYLMIKRVKLLDSYSARSVFKKEH